MFIEQRHNWRKRPSLLSPVKVSTTSPPAIKAISGTLAPISFSDSVDNRNFYCSLCWK